MDIGSPPSHGNRDEVIADSEEEIEYAKSFTAPSTKQQIVSSSIADRAKTRQRTQGTKKRPVIHRDDDIIELTSEDDVVEKGMKSSAQSVKPKPKAKVKVKMADNPLPSVTANPHIDAIDSEQPRPRVRPRPRPIVKQARLKLDSLPPHQYPFARDSFVYDMPAIRPPPISTPVVPYHGQPDLPIATSPATLNNALGTGMASQLPPSDLPNSSNTTGIGDTLPPIEILQDGESERDGDSRLLSPSSLFSDSGPKSKAKKRKRGIALDILENEHEVDQLMPSSPQRLEPTPHVGITILDACTHGPEPPPTFFAGSSSIGQYVGQRDSNAFPNPQAEVIDLTDLPPTICYAKPSKPKKIKVNTEINRTEDMCGDEGDSDFKPSGRKSAKKRKGKGKEPVQEKEDKPKEKKGRSRKKKEQMDGVVLQARDKTGKTKSKGKQNEKEVFKSREIIDDSDDENDPLLLVEGMQVAGMPLLSTAEGVSLPKISDLNAGGLSSASGKSSSPNVNEPNSSAVGSKAKLKLKGKKRKSIVESDEEGPEKRNEIQECIVVKRRKSASDAPVPDEVEQELVDEKKNTQESACNGKVKPSDEAGDRANTTSGARQDKTKDSKRTNEQKAGKENISGPSASSAVRPLAGRATSINPDVSTPLYSRYEVAPRRSSLPMSELIRRASLKPGSPFSESFTPSHNDRGKGKRPELDVDATTPLSIMTYSPYLKMSRRALSKIAPLHLNRKTPPLPAPAPPPKKKTKKELEREEKWEEELVESVGGIEVWASMEDSERKEMRRAKIDMEMGAYDD